MLEANPSYDPVELLRNKKQDRLGKSIRGDDRDFWINQLQLLKLIFKKN